MIAQYVENSELPIVTYCSLYKEGLLTHLYVVYSFGNVAKCYMHTHTHTLNFIYVSSLKDNSVVSIIKNNL